MMNIFNNSAYISADAVKNYQVSMLRTHPKHMGPPDSPYTGGGNNILSLEKKIGAEGITRAGTFEQAMLQALDKVSAVQQSVSVLEKEAVINPDSVDIHDITIAQAEASMSLNITRNILSRLVQGWRDLINTR
ncbi:MAG: flagellar hook-basal body complex protein FliE [Treponema sp.]|jgi:flagellar hook-basal body complex protein FliE|nr:flagellar hook-basal body complex protein FliE [Treponema sp.]